MAVLAAPESSGADPRRLAVQPSALPGDVVGAVILRCGHKRVVHRHYRAGSDCGVCRCAALTWWWPGRCRRWVFVP